MLFLYGTTIFVSAALLFLVQPMFARMAVPLLGGSPGVWNTCMVFFQAMLLAGYAYAHFTTRWLGVRRQAILHLFLLPLPIVVLPLSLAAAPPPPVEVSPIPWLLTVLALTVGLPFFVLSTTNPLLQQWFAASGHPAARDPYFLYAASNLGSMLALLSYPLVVEPALRLADQSRLWAAGYGALAALIAASAFTLWRQQPQSSDTAAPARPADAATELDELAPAGTVTMRRRLWWVLLSFVPSSLMLGVTTYLTTDIASVPLLWILPLALYLLTFILVFARRPPLPHTLMARLLPWVILPLSLAMAAVVKEGGVWVLLGFHLAGFFVAAMVCHGELARSRPSTEHLTEYYLWMSFGGVLGGLFNALLAPLLFSSVLEYPLVLMLACLLAPAARTAPAGHAQATRQRVLDVVLPALLLLVIAGLAWGLKTDDAPLSVLHKLILFGVPGMLCFAFAERPIRFGLGIGVILGAGAFYTAFQRQVLHVERSFFGVHRVTVDPAGKYHWLEHGTTFHGWQSLDPTRRCEPISYYFRTGPVGELFATHPALPGGRIAVLGLGTGSVAAYTRPGQHVTFFEIDPAVKRIAEDPRYFTFLADCSQGRYDIVLGDARIMLAKMADESFGMVMLDVFSSDAIPLHLLTHEALSLYLAKLKPGGMLVFNISNRYFDLAPVVGNLAADLGLICLSCPDPAASATDVSAGKSAAHFVVLARRAADLGLLTERSRWQRVAPQPGVARWTDDYANILAALKR